MGIDESFSWNEAKRRSNLEKHALDFTEVFGLVWDNANYQQQIVDFEEGIFGYVPYGINLRVVVFTERADKIHFISYRKATRREVINHVKNQ